MTSPDQDAGREYLVVREILEPMAHDPDKRGIRVSRARRSGVFDSDKVEDDEECDRDDDIDCESEISDLPSLTDIFLRSDSGFGGSADLNCKASASSAPVDRTGKECCREGDCESSGNPTATTAAGIRLGASQDNPIVLEDDQPVDISDAASPDDQNPNPRSRGPGPSQRFLPNFAWRICRTRHRGWKGYSRQPGEVQPNDPVGDEKEGGNNKSEEDDAARTRTLTRGNGGNECSGSGIG
ncbi:uncharacterized protein Z518_04478 [Rhinocladiella mackenziei CBS 650.93]|uniref:Uncharacterized protein n=1 Tax=Rhinocladiella mackenziei CBS 650.93 TaxID=1442369 RepID=A0A0D2FWG2_9EURO|nr:uncharacterized protein Z518_04478 [Rhinocladiella mackenziei CBS 650.93]KIX06502.1 hypothetical protein Z518_04478 [Rhinocladiella mackenziei CBS 650.93]